jgi:hypothetical protein
MFKRNNFIGREFFLRLHLAGHVPDLVISVGDMTPASASFELERTGGKWNPPAIPSDSMTGHFEYLADPLLWTAIREAAIDVVIQGGVGILKPDMISVPTRGFVNVHPGRLPEYRGNACPEWAVLNGDEVWATAHLIDAGIDTGPVICMRRYDFDDDWSYEEFRSHIYEHCASVLIEALGIIERTPRDQNLVLQPQDEARARYYPRMTAEQLAAVRSRFPRNAATGCE